MNERIQALVEQATSRPHRDQGIGGEPTHIYPGTFSVEKFAELLVRECADIAWKDSARYATFDNDTVMNGKADVLALCSHHIKQHFGVEE